MTAKEIKNAFDQGLIVIFNSSNVDTTIYKMSLIDVDKDGCEHYAFVSLNGKCWANGKYNDVSMLINGYEDDIKIFEPVEYVKYLKEEFLDEV
jgi:hypothetical protein